MEDEGRSAQYVPPRLARRQDFSPSQKPLTSGQRNRSLSSDGLSIPPVTDDDRSSLFEAGNGSDDDDDGSDKDKEEGIVAPKPKAQATTSIKSKPGKSVSKVTIHLSGCSAHSLFVLVPISPCSQIHSGGTSTML